MRTPAQAANRAFVAASLAFRASLEWTEHPRAASISASLLPWLEKHGIGDELDPIEREILAAPFRELRTDQETDLNVSGEAAWVFGWALGIVERPPACQWVDYQILVRRMDILRCDAAAFVSAATLRPVKEVAEFCVETLAIRTELHKARLPGGPVEVLDQVLNQRLSSLGLTASDSQLRQAAEFVHDLTDDERRDIAGIYFVRADAAAWLFDDRPTYYGTSRRDDD